MGRRAIDGRSGGLADTSRNIVFLSLPTLHAKDKFHGCRRHLHGISLFGERCDHGPEQIQVAGREHLFNRALGSCKSLRAKIGNGRHRRHDNFGFRELLDVPQQPLLARVDAR